MNVIKIIEKVKNIRLTYNGSPITETNIYNNKLSITNEISLTMQ